jgi:hypothetical protein
MTLHQILSGKAESAVSGPQIITEGWGSKRKDCDRSLNSSRLSAQTVQTAAGRYHKIYMREISGSS